MTERLTLQKTTSQRMVSCCLDEGGEAPTALPIAILYTQLTRHLALLSGEPCGERVTLRHGWGAAAVGVAPGFTYRYSYSV